MSLGYERSEYFMSSKNGYKTLIGVSHGYLGGFVFNVYSEEVVPNVKFFSGVIHRKVKFGGFLVDDQGNKLSPEELFDFAAYTRNTKIPPGSETAVTSDDSRFRFGKYQSQHLNKIINMR